MLIKLSRGEYWVLELVSELRYSIDYLFSSNIKELLNKPGHGLKRDELMEVFFSLINEKYIYISQHNEEIQNPSKSIIVKYLNTKHAYEDWIFYQLTQKGSEAWESFAQPEWSRYISTWFEPIDEVFEQAELECADKKHLKYFIESLKYHDLSIVEDSISEEILKPWNATYWKTLPLGYRVQFKCKWNKEDYSPPPPMWFDNLWYRWR